MTTKPYLRSSRLFRYFRRIDEHQYVCKICQERNIETVVWSRTYHVRQQHRQIYEREKQGLSGIIEEATA